MKWLLPFLIGAVISGGAVYYFDHQDTESEKDAILAHQSDSLRRANKAITDSLIKSVAKYHQTDSMLWVALNDTNHIKIKHEKIRNDHAALPADSATLLFLSRFGNGSD